MNNQGWIAAIVALVIGICIGYFLIPGPATSDEGPDRGRGLGADMGPPSGLPQVMQAPMGQWPKVDCTGVMALDMLEQIYHKAISDNHRGELMAPLGDQVLDALYGCAKDHQSPSPQHCARVQEALGAANAGDWQMARGKLDHADD